MKELEVLGGACRGRRVPVTGTQCAIGYEQHCQVRLEGPGKRGIQAVIHDMGEQVYLVGQSQGGVMVNNTPVSRVELHDGDTLTLGNGSYQFRYHQAHPMPPFRWESSVPESWQLLINPRELLQNPADRSILAGSLISLIAAFMPMFSFSLWGMSSSADIPGPAKLFIMFFMAGLIALASAKAYIIILIAGVNALAASFVMLFTSGSLLGASMNPGLGVIMLCAGAALIVYGSYRGFNKMYKK